MYMLFSTHGIRKKRAKVIVFRLNSDDYSKDDLKTLTKYIKSLGFGLKKSTSYSTTKLMSWTSFRIITDHDYISWEENDVLAKDIILKALPHKVK